MTTASNATHVSEPTRPPAQIQACHQAVVVPVHRYPVQNRNGACQVFQSEALGTLWSKLAAGELVIENFWTRGDSTILLLRRRSRAEAARGALGERRAEIIQRVLSGQCLSFIALDMGLSVSTISGEFRLAARGLGLDGRLAQLPVVLCQLWMAGQGSGCPQPPRPLRDPPSGARFFAKVPRTELAALEGLPDGEVEVSKLLLAGHSHAEIARIRKTSPRTVANQLASVFRKKGVSGRLELLTKLVRETFEPVPHALRARGEA